MKVLLKRFHLNGNTIEFCPHKLYYYNVVLE